MERKRWHHPMGYDDSAKNRGKHDVGDVIGWVVKMCIERNREGFTVNYRRRENNANNLEEVTKKNVGSRKQVLYCLSEKRERKFSS